VPYPEDTPTSWGAGEKHIYRIDGTLVINHNLTYDDTYTSISKIPRVVFIADNVVIDPDVTRIDPWIIAYNTATKVYGKISTCSDVHGGSNYFLRMGSDKLLSTKICDKKLTFNGPVVAAELYPYRTNGDNKDEPAEVFNLRADAFLSAYVGGGPDRPVVTTDEITELPPRF
jgi:hypothetical protein